MHTRKRMDSTGIKGGAVLTLINDISGGGKRARVSMSDMKAKVSNKTLKVLKP